MMKIDRGEGREDRRSETGDDRQRSTSNESRDDRGQQNDDSRPGLFGKIKRSLKSILKKGKSGEEVKTSLAAKAPVEKAEQQVVKEKPGRDTEKARKLYKNITITPKGRNHAKSISTTRGLSEPTATVRTLQSNDTDVRRASIHKTRASLHRLPQQSMVHDRRPSPKMLLQNNVLNGVGSGRPTSDNVLRWKRDSHSDVRSREDARRVERPAIKKVIPVQEGKATKQMSTADKLKEFNQKQNGKSKDVELER